MLRGLLHSFEAHPRWARPVDLAAHRVALHGQAAGDAGGIEYSELIPLHHARERAGDHPRRAANVHVALHVSVGSRHREVTGRTRTPAAPEPMPQRRALAERSA